MTERFARLRPLLGAALLLGVGSTAALALDPTPKWCEGVKIAAFPGGPQGGVFANNVYNGFRQAELDLGPTVTYYFSDWDPNKMLTQIQQAVATGVDGIATYGFAGEAATGPVVKQAYEQGIIFTTLNTALPESQAKYAPQGFGFVGAPNYDAGFALATEAANRSGLKAGDKVFVWGLKGQGGDRGQRTVGVHRRLREGRRRGDLPGDRPGDQRRPECRHGDLRRPDGRQPRQSRSWSPTMAG